LIADRRSVVRIDAFRTFVFVSLSAVVLWAFWLKKLKARYALVIWVMLILTDLWTVNKKYLNDSCFVSKKRAETPFSPTKADAVILKDKDPYYRVLNLSNDPFSDPVTSYFHKSVGGYHGAKLRRFQEMIVYNFSQDIDKFITKSDSLKTDNELDTLLSGLNTFNMFNTRYIIFAPEEAPVINKYALGNAWFVDNAKIVKNANEEIEAIKDISVQSTAVIDRIFEKNLTGKSFNKDIHSSVDLTSYAPNKLIYKSHCSSEQLAVFSEVYYPAGWIAKIDGIETPYFRADYILRSMVVPAGDHEIVFEFKPRSYKTGSTVSLASSILLILAVAGALFFKYRGRGGAKS